MSDPEEYYDEYRSTDDEEDPPVDRRVIAAYETALLAYAAAFVMFVIGFIAVATIFTVELVDTVGFDGFAISALVAGAVLFVVGGAARWYADHRQTRLEVQAIEDRHGGGNA